MDCEHEHVEPVITLDGKHVANLCKECLDRLPKSWPDCTAIMSWGGRVIGYV